MNSVNCDVLKQENSVNVFIFNTFKEFVQLIQPSSLKDVDEDEEYNSDNEEEINAYLDDIITKLKKSSVTLEDLKHSDIIIVKNILISDTTYKEGFYQVIEYNGQKFIELLPSIDAGSESSDYMHPYPIYDCFNNPNYYSVILPHCTIKISSLIDFVRNNNTYEIFLYDGKTYRYDFHKTYTFDNLKYPSKKENELFYIIKVGKIFINLTKELKDSNGKYTLESFKNYIYNLENIKDHFIYLTNDPQWSINFELSIGHYIKYNPIDFNTRINSYNTYLDTQDLYENPELSNFEVIEDNPFISYELKHGNDDEPFFLEESDGSDGEDNDNDDELFFLEESDGEGHDDIIISCQKNL
jgi:hypothetical protein